MLHYEIKKIFAKPINRVVMLALMMIVLIGSFLAIRDIKYLKEDGTSEIAFSAAHHLRSEKNKWKGMLTGERLKQAVEELQAVNAKAGTENAMLANRQGLDDIRDMINLAFSKTGDYNYYLADSLSPDEASSLYEKRISKLKEELSGGAYYSEKEKEYIIRQYEKLKTPLYYEYAEGWKALLDSQYLPTLMIITVVMIGFLVSGIFSDEFHLKADSIFFSAKLGRSKGIRAKIKAGIMAVSIVYWFVMLLFSLIIFLVLGFDGAKCMIQTGFSNWDSMYNLNYFQKWLLTMVGGYIGSLFILTFAMLISAKSHSTVLAVAIPFVLSCVPMFIGRVPLLTEAMNFFPDMLLRICAFIDVFLLFEAGGKVFGLYYVLTLFYFTISLIMIVFMYWIYKRTEIK